MLGLALGEEFRGQAPQRAGRMSRARMPLCIMNDATHTGFTTEIPTTFRRRASKAVIVEAILDGKYPARLMIKGLMEPFSMEWGTGAFFSRGSAVQDN